MEFAGAEALDGTVAAEVMLLERVTAMPPDGAGPFRVTVPVELVPPVTVVGFKDRELTEGGLMVSVAG